MLLPVVRRTWGRRGCTPVLWHRGRHRQKVSAIAALCVSPDRRRVRLYFQLLIDANFTAAAVLAFVGGKVAGPEQGRIVLTRFQWQR